MCKPALLTTCLIHILQSSQIFLNRELIFLHFNFMFLLYIQAFEYLDFQSHSWANLQLSRVQKKNRKLTFYLKGTTKLTSKLFRKNDKFFCFSSSRHLQLIFALWDTADTVENLIFFHVTLTTKWLTKAYKLLVFSHQ